jgi:hypothetical protein
MRQIYALVRYFLNFWRSNFESTRERKHKAAGLKMDFPREKNLKNKLSQKNKMAYTGLADIYNEFFKFMNNQ